MITFEGQKFPGHQERGPCSQVITISVARSSGKRTLPSKIHGTLAWMAPGMWLSLNRQVLRASTISGALLT